MSRANGPCSHHQPVKLYRTYESSKTQPTLFVILLIDFSRLIFVFCQPFQ